MSAERGRFEVERGGDGCTLRLDGEFDFRADFRDWNDARAQLESGPGGVQVDLTNAASVDCGTVAFLIELKDDLARENRAVTFVGAQGPVQSLIDLFESRDAREIQKPPPAKEGVIAEVGRVTLGLVGFVQDFLAYLGALTSSLMQGIRRPSTMNWKDTFRVMDTAGADGVPIVLLINFLIGSTIALQSADLLQQYGADIFVADGVAVSMFRTLGPLMTAIIIAGRSGAGFAAEIGTMKVNEEVDALSTLGLDAYRHLVAPRVLGLILAMPLLTMLGNVSGVLGGALVAVTQLDLTLQTYVDRVQSALPLRHVVVGLTKSLGYGVAISLIACQKGLAARGGAEEVGRSTTSSVVTIIVMIIVIESIVSQLFTAWGY